MAVDWSRSAPSCGGAFKWYESCASSPIHSPMMMHTDTSDELDLCWPFGSMEEAFGFVVPVKDARLQHAPGSSEDWHISAVFMTSKSNSN